MTKFETEEEYIHTILEHQLVEDKLIEKERALAAMEEKDIAELDRISTELSDLRRYRPPEIIAYDDLSLSFSNLREQHENIGPRTLFVKNYFQILDDCLQEAEAYSLNPDGSCSPEIRIATKLLLHELAIEYPDQIPFESYP